MRGIHACYCEKKPFDYLLEVACRNKLDLVGLARQEGCGTHCGWCVAYLRRVLETGQTEFFELIDREPLDLDEPESTPPSRNTGS